MLDAVDPTNVDTKGQPFTVRTVFVIDPKKVIRLTISYPAQVGRSFDEILRVVDSLQLGDKHRITTPVNWKKGDDVIVHPGVTDEQANELFPGFTKHLVSFVNPQLPSARGGQVPGFTDCPLNWFSPTSARLLSLTSEKMNMYYHCDFQSLVVVMFC